MNIRKIINRSFLLIWILIILAITLPSKAQESKPTRDPVQARELLLGNFSSARNSRFTSEEPTNDINGEEWAPMWSRITYSTSTGGNADIYSMMPFNNPYRLTSSASNESHPSLLHGGEKLAYVSDLTGNTEIFVLNINNGVLSQLTNDPSSDLYPAWAYNGARITFQSNRTENYEIYTMNSDGSNLVQLTFNSGYDGEPSWSRDGTKIAFTSNRSGVYEIWLMDANGANQHKITNNANAFTPSFSPTVDEIAYSADSDRDGFFDEIWIINADGTSPTQLFDRGIARDRWRPSWSPDGGWIGFIATDWVEFRGNWYWTQSLLLLRELFSGTEYNEFSDKQILSINWVSSDAQPPTACNFTSPSKASWSSYVLNWSANDAGESGIVSYYLQARSQNDSNWVNLLTESTDTSFLYQGTGEGVFEFRCKAKDASGNEADWSDAPITSVDADGLPPTSLVEIPSQEIRGVTGIVKWSGKDNGWGIESYDIWTKDGLDADWSLWKDDVTHTSEFFTGEIGHTYYFRSQATDLAGHKEAWQPSPQAHLSFFTNQLTVNVSDISDHPLQSVNFLLSPSETNSTTQNDGATTFYLSNSPTTTVSITSTGFGTLPQTTFTTTLDASVEIVLPPQNDLVQNGSFETGNLDGWNTLESTVKVVSDTWHTGGNSLEISGTSQITQIVTIDPALNQPTLSFFYSIPDNLIDGYFRMDIIDDEVNPIFITDADSKGWQHYWANLSNFSGETITVSIEYSGTFGAVWVDDVSIGAWESPVIKAISPEKWFLGEKPTISISGENFINSPTVFLDNTVLNSVTWLSDTLLTASIPIDFSEGAHSLRVENPSGISDFVDNSIQINVRRAYLPCINYSSESSFTKFGEVKTADWPTLGQNERHTGYNELDPGGSRYALAWQTALPYADYVGSEDVVIADGVLVVASDMEYDSGGVLAFNAATGQMLWRRDFEYKDSVNPPSIAIGRVFFQVSSNLNSYLYSLDLYTGIEKWKAYFTNDSGDFLSPLVVEDNILFNSGLGNAGIQSDNIANGNTRWINDVRYIGTIPGFDSWSPAYSNEIVYVWSGGIFNAFNVENGEALWNLGIGWQWHGYDMETAPVISNNTAFVTSPEDLYAINLNTHQIGWTSSGNYDDTMVATDGQSIYALHEKILEERSITDGTLLWSYTFDSNLQRAPVLTPNYLYVATSNNTYVFDRDTHQIVWQINKGGWLTVANGYLYIVQNDKTLLAFQAQEP